MKYKYGNTLSETLITLIVVGMVFTIAAGTMVADYRKNETVVRLQKIYSTFSQAFEKSKSLNGAVQSWDIPKTADDNKGTYAFFNEYLKPQLSIMLDCKYSLADNCNFEYKELTGTEKNLDDSWVRFFLNDGVFVALRAEEDADNAVIYFYIDSNGKKRLNVLARDIFLFEFWLKNKEHPEYEGIFFPYGHEFSRDDLISDKNDNNCNSSKNGKYCGALIQNDSWQIKEGYPWAQARYVVQ